MNKIEKARKEIEKNINEWGDLSLDRKKLEGFNLGVELAQKEFLEFLTNYKLITEKANLFVSGEVHFPKWNINNKIEELKKVVEDIA